MIIIGIAGNMGVGKDTTADILRCTRGFDVVALADAIKQLAYWLFQLDEPTLFGPSENRKALLPSSSKYWGGVRQRLCMDPDNALELFDENQRIQAWRMLLAEIERWEVRSDVTAREILQRLGTEWGRAIDPLVWIKALRKTVTQLASGGYVYSRVGGAWRTNMSNHPDDSPPGVAVPDCRFTNELQMIHELGGKTLWIEAGPRVKSMAGTHASEPHYEDLKAHIDQVVWNSGALSELESTVAHALKALGK